MAAVLISFLAACSGKPHYSAQQQRLIATRDHHNRGLELLQSGRPEDLDAALRQFDSALLLCPYSQSSYDGKMVVLWRKKDYPSLLAVNTDYAAHFPREYWLTSLQRAIVFDAAGVADSAALQYTQALARFRFFYGQMLVPGNEWSLRTQYLDVLNICGRKEECQRQRDSFRVKYAGSSDPTLRDHEPQSATEWMNRWPLGRDGGRYEDPVWATAADPCAGP